MHANKLCCEVNMEAACLRCPWKLCSDCWAVYTQARPEDALHPVYEVHDYDMKGQCIMGEHALFGIHFTRADEKRYESD